MNKAVLMKSEDIYIQPDEDAYKIIFKGSFGIDSDEISKEVANQLISYLKFHAQMDVSESRRPQLGAMRHYINDSSLYLRFSTVGNFNGQEIIVIRIIYELNKKFDMFFANDFQKLIDNSLFPGITFFSGPTGSGKTSLMYRLLNHCDDRNILCIEDPIEIINNKYMQLQVNNQIGMSYDELLKVALRHRPDIIVIGEIRDSTTAQTAIRAALSGHCILATVHARDGNGVINRLENFGVSKIDLENCINVICYQRMLNDKNNNRKVLSAIYNYESLKYDGDLWQERLKSLMDSGVISEANNKNII